MILMLMMIYDMRYIANGIKFRQLNFIYSERIKCV